MKAVKQSDKQKKKEEPIPEETGEAFMFHDYNLTQLRVPKDALPVEGRTYHGRHGYTVFSNNNAVPCFNFQPGSQGLHLSVSDAGVFQFWETPKPAVALCEWYSKSRHPRCWVQTQ